MPEQAEGAGWRVVIGRAYPVESGVPYALFADAFMTVHLEALKRFGRPILCTEYMARPAGSRFDPILDYLKEQKIGAYNWGFVNGKSQTIYPWDSWEKTYTGEPAVWFHDIFRQNGDPYDAKEVTLIRHLTR